MGRKPKYENPQSIIDSFFAAVSESFSSPSEGEQGRDGHKKQELLADEFGISRIKVRKILITTGDITNSTTNSISALLETGLTLPDVCEQLSISLSTANSLLPYSKGVYGLDVSAAADRTAIYRSRAAAVKDLHESLPCGDDEEQRLALWKTVCLFAGYPFVTSGRGSTPGKKFRYVISEPGGAGGRKYEGSEVDGFGNELFIIPGAGEDKGKRREKSISRSSVDYAFDIVRAAGGGVSGPKQLKVYGSSYVYSLFVRFGLIRSSVVDDL